MNKTILAGVAGMLVAGGAIAAYQTFGTPYADVVSSTPIIEKEPIYGDVVSSNAVTEMRTGSRQVCEDVAVEKRRPERFGDKDGMVVGAVVGGLVGNQVGGGDGPCRKRWGGVVVTFGVPVVCRTFDVAVELRRRAVVGVGNDVVHVAP